MLGFIFGKKQTSREVEVQVTEMGFEPSWIRVRHDEATTIVVTRKTSRTSP